MDEDINNTDCTILPVIPCYERVLEKWKGLKQIVDRPNVLKISLHLVKSYTCFNLKYLEVSFNNFFYFGSLDNLLSQPNLEALIENIHNSPALERITLRDTVISLENTEKLHAGAPQLVELLLDNVHLLPQEKEAKKNIIVECPAYHLKSFSFQFSSITEVNFDNVEFQQTVVTKWLRYIGEKYKYVNDLNVCFVNGETFNVPNLLEEPVANALSKIMDITSYVMEVYPIITPCILDRINMNNIRLKKLEIWIKDNRQVEQQFKLLKSTQPTKTIEALTVTSIDYNSQIDILILSCEFIESVSNLNHLSNLTVQWWGSQHGG